MNDSSTFFTNVPATGPRRFLAIDLIETMADESVNDNQPRSAAETVATLKRRAALAVVGKPTRLG